MISTSTIKISCVIQAREVEKAVRAIPKKFGLDKDVVMRQTFPPRGKAE